MTPPPGDGQARTGMRAKLRQDTAAERLQPGSVAGGWKWEVRKKVWDYMEANNVARCAWREGGVGGVAWAGTGVGGWGRLAGWAEGLGVG